MIAEGRIAIDGKPVETPATLLASLHGVTVDGKPVKAPAPARLFRFHKPAGLLTTERDPKGRPTIYDRLPGELPRLMPVGRLDMNTEGLLLLTTDGELKRQLELPATGVERTYRARAFGEISQERLEQLIEGIEIEGVRYGPIDANLERRTGRNQWIELRLREGKNREVRRVLEHLGLQVSRLLRTAYGPFALGDLPAGEVDEIRQHDLVAFRKSLALPPGERDETAMARAAAHARAPRRTGSGERDADRAEPRSARPPAARPPRDRTEQARTERGGPGKAAGLRAAPARKAGRHGGAAPPDLRGEGVRSDRSGARAAAAGAPRDRTQRAGIEGSGPGKAAASRAALQRKTGERGSQGPRGARTSPGERGRRADHPSAGDGRRPGSSGPPPRGGEGVARTDRQGAKQRGARAAEAGARGPERSRGAKAGPGERGRSGDRPPGGSGPRRGDGGRSSEAGARRRPGGRPGSPRGSGPGRKR